MLPSPIPEKEDMMAMPRSKVVIVHVTGPLAPYVTEVESSLEDCGYTPLTRIRHLQVMVHLSRWLQARQLGVGELTGRRVEQYLAERRAAALVMLTCGPTTLTLPYHTGSHPHS
jgi:hypothetical protein